MEGRLPGIAEEVTVFAAVEGHAYQPVDGNSDIADRAHLLVDDIRRHVSALEQIAVEPPEVAVDLLFLPDFLDAVDGSGLAVAKSFVASLPLILIISLTRSSH